MAEFSEKMGEYFKKLKAHVDKLYEIAGRAKSKGLDPDDDVEIPVVESMAERVEGLISVIAPQVKGSGISERIKELEEQYGSLDWRVALTVALEIAKETYCKFKDKKEAMEIGIRVGFAYITMGVVSSPLEGFINLDIRKRKDGKEYFAINYGGPIRSAGGTGASVSLLITDYIRKNMGYEPYDPTEEEIKRFVTEIYDYHDRITNLQYLPSEAEIDFLARHIPVQIDGDGSEKIEVSNYKDLERVGTNQIRNGVCLTMAEGIAQKAPKVWKQVNKWGKDFGLDDWMFLGEFVALQKNIKAKSKAGSNDNKEKPKILPDFTFIKDLVGGRPVLAMPLANGGFRLRYGRSRTSGYSSYSIHPSTMFILNNFIAIGTQLKNERPGKGCTVTVCDTIEGPIVKLKNGKVLQLNDVELAKKVAKDIDKILFLGDILMNYGDFFNRNHNLVPAGYCEEWWIQEFEKAIINLFGELDFSKTALELNTEESLLKLLFENPFQEIKEELAFSISFKFGIPLHPQLSYHWNSVTDLKELLVALADAKVIKEDKKIIMNYKEGDKFKEQLELLGIEHELVNNEFVVISKKHAYSLYTMFNLENLNPLSLDYSKENLEVIREISKVKLRDKSGIFIGARMGRPEKSKMRQLQGSPHVLFPIGEEGGRLRSFQSALEAKKVNAEFPLYYCEKCKKETIYRVCEVCGERTKQSYYCKECGITTECEHDNKKSYKRIDLDINHYFSHALIHLGMKHYPDLIKGVRGTSNKTHEPEHLAKGILRSKHDVYVNKDGTIRYDITQMPITHFKPKEIGTPITRLKELGYDVDIKGKPLEDEEQILELKPQDIILPKNIDAPEEGSHDVLLRAARFIDDELVNFYRENAFYNAHSYQDLVGHLLLVLAPHTSGGIVGRIIGFSDTQGLFAHPNLHAATRRDCDGDEASVSLLLDILINFSRHYLPNNRGSTQDAPLVLTWKLTPSEVDDMAFDIDIVWKYPLEFYEAALNYKKPYDIELDQIGKYLGKEKQYEGMGFTHDTSNMNKGVLCSAYKTLPSMQEKIDGQMDLAVKIRAVEESFVASLIIEKHFLKDIKGNLRKFSMQQFRCVNCNTKYRRPPLSGKCSVCGGKIIFTISEGSIIKYLEPSLELGRKYNIPEYLKRTLELLEKRVEGVFGKDAEKQEGLDKWFG